MMYHGGHMSGWGWFGMSLSAVVFSGLMITGIVLLVRYLCTPIYNLRRRQSRYSASGLPAARSTRPSTTTGWPRC
jgi:hypothetical protein